MRSVASRDVISFIKEHIIHRFGIPQTITTDGGSVFIAEEFRKFADDMGRDENGRKRSEEASIVFSFTFFLGNDIDNSIDGNEYGADNTGTSETKLSDRE